MELLDEQLELDLRVIFFGKKWKESEVVLQSSQHSSSHKLDNPGGGTSCMFAKISPVTHTVTIKAVISSPVRLKTAT